MSYKSDRIKELVKAGKPNDEIKKIIAEETDIELLFQTVTTGLKTAWDSYKGPDMASLNVAVDNLNAVRKNVAQLTKLLEEKKANATQPGAGAPPEVVPPAPAEEVSEKV